MDNITLKYIFSTHKLYNTNSSALKYDIIYYISSRFGCPLICCVNDF